MAERNCRNCIQWAPTLDPSGNMCFEKTRDAHRSEGFAGYNSDSPTRIITQPHDTCDKFRARPA